MTGRHEHPIAPRRAESAAESLRGAASKSRSHREPRLLVSLAMLIVITLQCVEGSAVADEPPQESSPATSDWPVFRGTVAGSGVARSALPADLQVLWEFQAAGSFFAATAAIVDGVVYVGDAEKKFYAIHLKTGKEIWNRDVEMGFLASPAVRNGRVYIGDSNGMFYCLEAHTGVILWSHDTGAEINSSANFYQDSVLVGSQSGTLYRFNAKDGSIVWEYTIEASGGIQCTPSVADNCAFVCGCDSNLHVIDLDNGKSINTISIGDPTLSTPAIVGKHAYFGNEGGSLFSINWHELSIDWKYQNARRRTPYRSSVAVTAHAVIVGGRNKLVEAVDRKTGKPIWSFTTKGRVDSSPVVVGNRVFIGSSDGRLYQLNLADGVVSWSYDAGAGFEASAAVAENRLVIGNQAGVLYCFGN